MPRYEADGLLESPQAAYGSEYSADYGGREAPIEPVSEQGIVGHYEFEAARDRNPLLRRVTRRRPQDNSLEAILERTKLLNDVCAPSHIGNGIYISKSVMVMVSVGSTRLTFDEASKLPPPTVTRLLILIFRKSNMSFR